MDLGPGTDRPLDDPIDGRPTRGFLFSDLRGYTAFLEKNGAEAATQLLGRYRRIVRAAIARHRGAEIRTEGDGFYVVFPSVSGAVTCGLEIMAGAAADTSGPSITIGIGIHAGEAVESSEGYVGSSVNVAARLCALAGPGEVLVSDTVRALTKSVLDVMFVSRGRKSLKGVAEPVLVYAAMPPLGQGDRQKVVARPAGRVFAAAGAAIAIALAVGGLAWVGAGRPASSSAPPSPSSLGGGRASPSSAELRTFIPGASPSASPGPTLNGREEQLAVHVPAQWKAGCGPAPGLTGRAQIVCAAPQIGSISYIAFDDIGAMRTAWEASYRPNGDGHDLGNIASCPEGPYQRLYYQSAETQKGRVACFVNANIPTVAWTDERLAIIAVAKSTDLQGPGLSLEGLHQWWELRSAGPIP